LNQEVKNLI